MKRNSKITIQLKIRSLFSTNVQIILSDSKKWRVGNMRKWYDWVAEIMNGWVDYVGQRRCQLALIERFINISIASRYIFVNFWKAFCSFQPYIGMRLHNLWKWLRRLEQNHMGTSCHSMLLSGVSYMFDGLPFSTEQSLSYFKHCFDEIKIKLVLSLSLECETVKCLVEPCIFWNGFTFLLSYILAWLRFVWLSAVGWFRQVL